MKMQSIWADSLQLPSFEPIQRDIKTDVLIIGGGISGILCAFLLQKEGVNCVLVEAEKICGGITRNTTAKITLQHGLIYDYLLRSVGLEKTQMYFQANQAALNMYRQLSEDIDCDFEDKNNYVYSKNDRVKLEREALALNRIGCPAQLIDKLELPIDTAGAVCVKHQAQFHPLKFVRGIIPNLTIYENTRVIETSPGIARTQWGNIHADQMIAATHFPFINKHGLYFLKMYQHRSYVLALGNVQTVQGMYVDESEKGFSFRSYGDLLLLGGGGHRTGKRGGGWKELESFAQRHYPDAHIAAQWAAQDCMTLDKMPYIGQYSKHTPNLYAATGFNKWGMTGAMTSALLLKDMVLGRGNAWSEVFSPARSIFRAQLAVNAAETMVSMITPTVPRCPHLGCALKYNPQEHSWDCPCHGSRFDMDGHLLDTPANSDMKRK